MNTLRNSVIEMLSAEAHKNTSREAFRTAHIGDEGYDQIRGDFRSADDSFENASEVVITNIQRLMSTDELADAVAELRELSQSFNRFAESRGLAQLLASDGTGLSQMAKRWKKAAAKMTACKRINLFRRDLSVADFEETLAGISPSNIDSASWEAAVVAFNTRLEEFNEKTNYEVDPAMANLEVAFDLEDESRRAYDAVTEKFVVILSDLLSTGRLESEMDELDHSLLSVVRDALTRVPQAQAQTKTQTATRSVTVI